MMRTVRRTAVHAAALLSMTFVLAACGGGDDGSEPEATGATGAPSEATDTSGFPEGSFEHTATVEEAVENGFAEQEASEEFGPDGELPITFVFEDGTWQQIEVDDDGVSEVGDNGTYTVDGDELTTVSDSDGCPGCTIVYRWTFDGETLDLVLLTDSAGEGDAHGVRLHTEYAFEQAS